ncbi:cytochrome P450 [Trametes maxima]|nr:cytochrome P450 [Trametes maxima]
MPLLETLPTLAYASLAFILWASAVFLARMLRSPVLRLPGPRSPSFFLGYAKQFWVSDPTELHEEWVRIYGRTFSYRILSYVFLYTVDIKALSYIISHTDAYQKPHLVASYIAEMVGYGTLVTEGEQHRKQKRVISPAFGPAQIRGYSDLFLKQAAQLHDVLSLEVSERAGAPVDMYDWLHRVTLDTIAEAAFGCSVNTLDHDRKPNELCDALRLITRSVTRSEMLPMLRFFIPALRFLPDEKSRLMAGARKTMREFAIRRIEQKRQELQLSDASPKPPRRLSGDFLTLLVEANLSPRLSDGQRISDEAMIDECCTFLVAGHETLAAMLPWLFFNLGRRTRVQEKLRSELRIVGTDCPTADELAALRYLDCVVREVVRLHPSAPSSIRVAAEDTTLPLRDSVHIRGQAHDRISVTKGTPIVLPILAMNRDRALWGEDAFEFRPERWDSLPETVSGIPGVWGNTLSFWGGQHACIGYRFALNQMRFIVFKLLREFEFELACPPEDIGKSSTVVVRPMKQSEPEKGPQLPMYVRPCRQD